MAATTSGVRRLISARRVEMSSRPSRLIKSAPHRLIPVINLCLPCGHRSVGQQDHREQQKAGEVGSWVFSANSAPLREISSGLLRSGHHLGPVADPTAKNLSHAKPQRRKEKLRHGARRSSISSLRLCAFARTVLLVAHWLRRASKRQSVEGFRSVASATSVCSGLAFDLSFSVSLWLCGEPIPRN